MDTEKVKLIIRNMELLLDNLKAEIYSDSPVTVRNQSPILDYDEIYDDDD